MSAVVEPELDFDRFARRCIDGRLLLAVIVHCIQPNPGTEAASQCENYQERWSSTNLDIMILS